MLFYSQKSGQFRINTDSAGRGYAGNGRWKNDPASQAIKGHGPLPRGLYHLTGVKEGGPTGPFTIVLEPDLKTPMYGRGDFRIHGDKADAPGTASDGCIILPRAMREKIWASGERLLTVTE